MKGILMAEIDALNEFTTGTKAKASEVNDNFETLREGHNINDGRIEDIETSNIVNVVKDGAIADDVTDDTEAFQKTADDADSFEIPEGSYIVGNIQSDTNNIRGQGQKSYLYASEAGKYVLVLGRNNEDWVRRLISNLYMRGNSTGGCVKFGSNNGDTEYAGRVIFDACNFKEGEVYKPAGNIGNVFRACTWHGTGEYGYRAIGNVADGSSDVMHVGCDYLKDCKISNKTLAAIFIDGNSIDGTGQTIIENTILTSNPGFGIFVKDYGNNSSGGMTVNPFTMRNIWFEDVATSSTVVIDGETYYTYDIRLENTKIAVIEGSNAADIELVNSVLILKENRSNGARLGVDKDASAIYENIYSGNYFKHNNRSCLVRSIGHAEMPYAGLAAGGNCFPIPARTNITNNFKNNVVLSESFAFAESYAQSGVSVVDGVTFPRCCEITVPAGNTYYLGTNYLGAYANTIPVDKYIVWSIEAKILTATSSTFGLRYGNDGFVTNIPPILNEWSTYGGIVPPASDAHLGYDVAISIYNPANQVDAKYRIGAYQIMAFDTLLDAQHYLENRFFYLDTPGKHSASTTPTLGTFKKGHKIESLVAASGGTAGWICTTAGTNGTLAGVTGSIKTATKYLTLNSLTGIERYDYINIVGVTGTKRIMHLPTAIGATTVSSSSASGQNILNLTDTTNFNVNDYIKIYQGNTNEEIHYVVAKSDTTLTLKSNLAHTHAPAVTVKTCVAIDSVSDATVTGAAVSYNTPVWKTYGVIA